MSPSMEKVPTVSYLSNRYFKFSKWESFTSGLHAFQTGVFALGPKGNKSVSEPFKGGRVGASLIPIDLWLSWT